MANGRESVCKNTNYKNIETSVELSFNVGLSVHIKDGVHVVRSRC